MQNALYYTLTLFLKLFDSSLGAIVCFDNGAVNLLQVNTGIEKSDELYNNISDFVICNVNGSLSKRKLNSTREFKVLQKSTGCLDFHFDEIIVIDNKKYFLLLLFKEKNNFTVNQKEQFNIIFNVLTEQLKNYSELPEDLTKDFSKILLESGNDLIFIMDRNGKIKSVNKEGALILDYQTEEILGQHFLQFIVDDVALNIGNALSQILKTKEKVLLQASFESKYGKKITFKFTCIPLLKNGKVTHIIGIGNNITELIQSEEKGKDLNAKLIEAQRLMSVERDRIKQHISVLEELNRLKSDFVANISHELRTPLSSIIGFSETIASDPEMPEEMRNEFNDIILMEGKRLAKLINDILDISKLEGRILELDKKDFDIIELMHNIVNSYDKMTEKKDIKLSTTLPDSPVLIYGDKEKIYQALNNIVNNAVKFTEGGGRVLIKGQLLEKEIEFIVSDTGIGIPEKDLPSIFQKFFRVHRPGNEFPGTRLGLSLAKQIIDLHKGFIVVQSEENKGTTFIITLPIKPQTNGRV